MEFNTKNEGEIRSNNTNFFFFQDACHNYVSILTKDDAEHGILICGTNAFQPLCRKYEREKYGDYRESFEFSGLGIAPYDPRHNSTFLRDADLLYAGTGKGRNTASV